jgi:ABC-type lipoprotein release transport system permease subunit
MRRRWAAWLGVVLLAGVGGGGVLTLLSGAARTSSAYRDFSTTMHAADAVVAGRSAFGLAGAVDLDQVARLPQVRTTARASVSLVFTGRTDSGRRVGPVDFLPVMPTDDGLGRRLERARFLEGRPADQHRVSEATASFVLADRLGLHVGSRIRLRFVRASSFPATAAVLLSNFGARLAGDPGAASSAIDQLADGPDVTVRIVGVEASPAEFPPVGPDLSPPLHLTRAFADRYVNDLVSSPLLYVGLRAPDQLDAFSKSIERLAAGQPAGFVQSRGLQTPKVERAIQVQATAVRIVAILAAIALLVVVGQALLRQADANAPDEEILTALGLSRHDALALTATRGALIGVGAAVVAVIVAIVASPIMPVGLARTANLHTGLAFEPLLLATGALVIAGAVVALALLAAGRARAHATRRVRPRALSWWGRLGERRSVPASVDVGMRFALDPGGARGSTPVWTTVIGATLTIALLAGLWTFESSLQHLLDTPPLYGWNWDVKTGAPALPDISAALIPAFAQDPVVSAFAAGTITQAEMGLERVDVMGMDQEQGTVAPTILQGRLPRGPDEVMLGRRNLAREGLRLGDIAVLRLGNIAAGLRIVGVGLFPEFGDAGGLGNGVYVTFAGLQRLLPEARRNVFLVRYTGGTDAAAQTDHLRRAVDPLPTRSSGEPQDVQALSSVSGLPAILGALLALLAAATLAHTLVSSVRRRRRELAILQTMGFVRRQMRLAVYWQTATLVSIALLVGVPLGILAGRFAWNSFADNLGIVATTSGWLPVVLIVPGVFLLAAAIAAVPAGLAARIRPMLALRAE